MIAGNQTRLCQVCGKPVKGRTDKKFCDDYCRNHYNNLLKADSNNLCRNINNTLRKNRRLLEQAVAGGRMARVTKAGLAEAGFSFRYSTHSHCNKQGSTYFFCYDHGYLQLDDEWCLVIKED